MSEYPTPPRVHYVPFGDDLYAITLDDFGDMVACEVSRGNRRAPYEDIHPNAVPREVFNRLFHNLIKGR